MMCTMSAPCAQSIKDPKARREAVMNGRLAPERFDTLPEIILWTVVALGPMAYLATESRLVETLMTDRAWLTLIAIGGLHVAQSGLDMLFIFQDKFMKNRIPAHTTIIDKPLDDVSLFYIRLNRWQTIPGALAVAYYACTSDNVINEWSETTFLNTVAVLPLWLTMYDAVYYWFHRILHIRAIYPYIHKHHHKNVSPFRGNIDGINTHPVEYFVGLYLHLFCMSFGPRHSIYGLYLFTAVAGFFASVNHTRFNICIPPVFHVKDHDNHHRYFTVCYGQYVMFWDHLFGTYMGADTTEKSKAKIQ